LRNWCSGGCPATNFVNTGSIFECADAECRFVRGYLEVSREITARARAMGLEEHVNPPRKE
jgi:sulfatase maturation enzyme AslB (radical SAM superfamily)